MTTFTNPGELKISFSATPPHPPSSEHPCPFLIFLPMRIDSPCEDDDDDDDDDDYVPDKVNALNKPTWWRCLSVFGVWGTEDINWATLWKVWCVV